VTVVPRSGEVAMTGAAAERCAGAATAVVEAAAALFGAADSTSSLRIRPPIPVPLTLARFTPRSLANLRTIGVT
jgi:hypothetical protein